MPLAYSLADVVVSASIEPEALEELQLKPSQWETNYCKQYWWIKRNYS